MNLRKYKSTYVAKNSMLALALEKSETEAKKVYNDTTARFEALYGKEDATWMYNKAKEYDK